MARTSFTLTSQPIVLSKQLPATLRCSIGPSSAVRRNGRTRRPAGPSQHPMCGGAATTNINKPNSPKLTDRFVQGPEAIRAYWTEQWGEISPHVEPVAFHQEDARRVLVEVPQVVRDLVGTVLADEHVGHRFTIERDLIRRMEVSPLPSSAGQP